jgi:N-acetylmuramoyl-L-alanine amidase
MSKIFIGVGHGGADPGAVANGFKEKDLNLAIALACRDVLEAHGVTVGMSRHKDENDDLREEIRECNAFAPDYALDIHNNAGGGDGVEIFHSKAGTADDKLAQNVLDAIKAIGQNSRGLKTLLLADGRDYYGFIRQVNAPSIIVECAFVDNKNDLAIIDTAAEQKAMGEAIAKGVLKTLGISEKATATATKPAATSSFFPAKGYFSLGDTHANIGKIASFMRRVFPAYTNKKALGDYYGQYIQASIKEFQRRTGLEADGCVGPITLAELEKYGFKK